MRARDSARDNKALKLVVVRMTQPGMYTILPLVSGGSLLLEMGNHTCLDNMN